MRARSWSQAAGIWGQIYIKEKSLDFFLSKFYPAFIQSIYCIHGIKAESKHVHLTASKQQPSFELTACCINTVGGSHGAVAAPPAICKADTRPFLTHLSLSSWWGVSRAQPQTDNKNKSRLTPSMLLRPHTHMVHSTGQKLGDWKKGQARSSPVLVITLWWDLTSTTGKEGGNLSKDTPRN